MPDRKKDALEQTVYMPQPPGANAYCARLDLPVPRVENVATKTDAKLFHLMVVSLLERGEPLSLDAIAERLRVAGVSAATGDIETSLLKSWHGSRPVFRDDRGFFALDVTAWELKSIIFRLELRPSERLPANCQPEIEPVADNVPLTEEEVRAAFESASPDNLSNVRRIAAVLDNRRELMSCTDAEACVAAWNSPPVRVKPPDLQRWPKSCVTVLEGDLLRIDLQSPHLFAMRRAVRKLAERRLKQAAIDEQLRDRRQAYEAREAERRERDRALAENLRRTVLRVVPEQGTLAAAALLDIGQRVIRSFVGSELLELPAVLKDYDLIAAIWTRETLYSLGIRDHDRWRLVDLKPPQKTRQLNRAGRKLTITPELLISGTTGISRPLGDPTKIAEYLTRNQQTKLRRRLERDVKSLFAFYNYGLLHRRVRLRWGFLDEDLGVDWAQPEDPSLHSVLEECRASGQEVEIVTGSLPGWTNPWSRSVRVQIVSFDFMMVTVQSNEAWTIHRDEIQAIRVVAQTPDCQTRH
jgi:hypothetical protein